MDGQVEKKQPEQSEVASAVEDTIKQITSTYYTIEQVATRTGLTKRTLRYYEEMELLQPASRTEGNYRRYTQEDIQRIERIKGLRDLLGFSLNDIRTIFQAEDERNQMRLANRDESDIKRRLERIERADELLQEQLELVKQKMSGLQKMHNQLQERLEAHKGMKQELKDLLVQE